MIARQRVLFLCTHNSARSQMAEGLLRAIGGDRYDVCSAGTVATTVRPEAIEVMKEIGIDISRHESKTVAQYLRRHFTWVVTVCDEAAEACPIFPGDVRRVHWSLPDPGRAQGSETERWARFRDVRDRLRELIDEFVQHA